MNQRTTQWSTPEADQADKTHPEWRELGGRGCLEQERMQRSMVKWMQVKIDAW